MTTDSEEDIYLGSFWLQASPETVRDGVLKLRRSARSELIVNPDLYPGMEFTNVEVAPDGSTKSDMAFTKDRGPQTLHGFLGDLADARVAVSMMEAHSVRWAGTKQTFAPLWSLVGGHVERSDPFQGVRVRVPRFGASSDGPASIASGGTVEVDGSSGWVVVADIPPRSYRELDRTVVRPVCTLLTLATGQGMRPSDVEVSPEKSTWWPIFAESHVRVNPSTSESLIPLSAISADVLATWLDRTNILGPLPAGVASVFESHLSIDTEVLILTTIAEGLHRAIHPDVVRFGLEEAEQVRAAATEAAAAIAPDAGQAVNGFLTHVHEVGYARRLKHLSQRAEELMPGITGNSNRWRNLVYDIRNAYAHKSSTGVARRDNVPKRRPRLATGSHLVPRPVRRAPHMVAQAAARRTMVCGRFA